MKRGGLLSPLYGHNDGDLPCFSSTPVWIHQDETKRLCKGRRPRHGQRRIAELRDD
jgi:hypothetical protein